MLDLQCYRRSTYDNHREALERKATLEALLNYQHSSGAVKYELRHEELLHHHKKIMKSISNSNCTTLQPTMDMEKTIRVLKKN